MFKSAKWRLLNTLPTLRRMKVPFWEFKRVAIEKLHVGAPCECNALYLFDFLCRYLVGIRLRQGAILGTPALRNHIAMLRAVEV